MNIEGRVNFTIFQQTFLLLIYLSQVPTSTQTFPSMHKIHLFLTKYIHTHNTTIEENPFQKKKKYFHKIHNFSYKDKKLNQYSYLLLFCCTMNIKWKIFPLWSLHLFINRNKLYLIGSFSAYILKFSCFICLI